MNNSIIYVIKKTLKKIYITLPFSENVKCKMKDYFYILFSPFIKDTYMYRTWKNSKHQVNFECEKNDDNNASFEQQYINQILRTPYDGPGSKYYEDKNPNAVVLQENDVRYIAFYLPQFHCIKENDEWWGKGFTEWINTTKSMPLFLDHYQPRLVGDLGFYDLTNANHIKEQMDLAKHYGIAGFCIYYYWFNGKKLLDQPLHLILNNQDLDLPFCLCWANENWTRRWDGLNADILMEQKYDDDFAQSFIMDVSVYFNDSRYIRINGKPLLIIYNANEIKNIDIAINIWRKYCKENGYGGVYLIAVDYKLNNVSKTADFDAFVEFPPHSTAEYKLDFINDKVNAITDAFEGIIYSYKQIVKEKKYLYERKKKTFKGIMLNWDNTARRKNCSTVFHDFKFEFFKEWLNDITIFTKDKFLKDERLVFINAWNEWAEGTYLEPDRRYGYAALNAVREVIVDGRTNRKKIIYISHDAYLHGAQFLSLNIIKNLSEEFHYDVYCILKNSGDLVNEFKKYSKELICIETDLNGNLDLLAEWVLKTRATKAICNTVVVGDVLKAISQCNVNCISLIHEMEKVIRQYNCEENLQFIINYAIKIVFASNYVLQSVSHFTTIPNDKTLIYPQGMYMINPYINHKAEISLEIKRKHNIPEKNQVVIGVGFGDFRKGIDLFVKCAAEVCLKIEDVSFLWIGNVSPDMESVMDKILHNNSNNIIFAGFQSDPMKYYMVGDLFLLTSREDPFPTVVMEAMYAKLPVIAFNGGGGYVDIVSDNTGKIVEMENYKQMADVCITFLMDKTQKDFIGNNGYELVRQRFNFKAYIYKLLELLGNSYSKISVIIPNYNYGKYLKDRINSILKQSYPIFEIIILDDCSTDNSIDIIKTYEREYPLLIKTFYNTENSGSVFSQWEKGIDVASGNYIWIAEADDLSDENFLETLMAKFQNDSEIIMAYTQSKMLDQNGQVVCDNYHSYTDDIDKEIWHNDYVASGKDEIMNRLSIKNTIPNVSAVVFKNTNLKDFLADAKEYKVAGDWMFYIRLLQSEGRIAFSCKSLNFHRRHDSSVTKDLNKYTHYEEICKVHNFIIRNFNLSEDIKIKIKYYESYLKDFFQLNN